MSAPDLFAASMLLSFGFAFGVILTIVIVIARNAGKKDELENILDDENETPPPPEQASKGPEIDSGQIWEKDADWWKHSDN